MTQTHHVRALVFAAALLGAGCSQEQSLRPDPSPFGASADAGSCPAGLPGPALVELKTPAGVRYCMDRTEVTQTQYAAFIEGSKADPKGVKEVPGQPQWCRDVPFELVTANPGAAEGDNAVSCPASAFDPATMGDLPAVCVTHCAARAYCHWAGKALCGSPAGRPLRDLAASGDPEQSAWMNACSGGGKRQAVVAGGVERGICSPVTDGMGHGIGPVESSAQCVADERPFASVLGLGSNVMEWEDNCEPDGCAIRGAIHALDPQDAKKRIVSDACGEDRGITHDANRSIGFRCCKALLPHASRRPRGGSGRSRRPHRTDALQAQQSLGEPGFAQPLAVGRATVSGRDRLCPTTRRPSASRTGSTTIPPGRGGIR